MKKIIFTLIVLFANLLVCYANNIDNKEIVLSTNTKYYKTVTIGDINNTYEITKEEYDSYNPNSSLREPVETEYKKLTTTIISGVGAYKYKAKLVWKKMPSTRSYDIIGIGFINNVEQNGGITFKQEYCYSSGNCNTSTSKNNTYTGNNGVGVSFKLPTGSLTSLSQELYFYVSKKNPSSTITNQRIVGDYSHATSSISSTNAKKYTVNNTSGIALDSSISSYYDAINPSITTWNGTW